jgi:hypothetical protein
MQQAEPPDFRQRRVCRPLPMNRIAQRVLISHAKGVMSSGKCSSPLHGKQCQPDLRLMQQDELRNWPENRLLSGETRPRD